MLDKQCRFASLNLAAPNFTDSWASESDGIQPALAAAPGWPQVPLAGASNMSAWLLKLHCQAHKLLLLLLPLLLLLLLP